MTPPTTAEATLGGRIVAAAEEREVHESSDVEGDRVKRGGKTPRPSQKKLPKEVTRRNPQNERKSRRKSGELKRLTYLKNIRKTHPYSVFGRKSRAAIMLAT